MPIMEEEALNLENPRVEKIVVTGLQKTNEEFVRKNISTKVFDVSSFNDLLIETSQLVNHLKQLGCFKSTNVFLHSKEKPNSYDLVVEVEESSSIGGGISGHFGNNDGSLSTSVFFPNLFGKGEKLTTEYTYGSRNFTDYRVNLSSPLNDDPNQNLSFSLFRSSNDYSWSKYKEISNGILAEIKKPYTRLFKNKYELKGSHIFTYEGVWRHTLSNIDSTFAVRKQSGHSLKSSIQYTNVIDRRNLRALPSNGGYLKSSVELAGLGGDIRFVKFTSDYQYSKTFYDYITAQVSCSSGVVLPWKKNDKIKINDKFFLGGPLNLRGFSVRGAGPHVEDCSLGDDMYWLLGAHIYTPLPFLHKNKTLSSWLKTHSFINMGNILSFEKLSALKENQLHYILNNARLSVGTGLVIAFGDIARVELNYALPLWKDNKDKSVNGLQFGIGVHFN